MGTFWCYSVAVDQVRDIFGAPEPEATGLRAIAAERFGARAHAQPGLLGKLGPLFRRPPDAPVISPDSPGREDCDRILSGQHVPPHRLAASWSLLQTWIEARAWSSHTSTVDSQELGVIEFDLARAGVPARHSVNGLLGRDLGIGMLPAPGTAAGYCTGEHAIATARAWRDSLPELAPDTARWVVDLLDWLEHFEEWTAAAGAQHRPPPDLVGVLAG
ncbi:MAG: hypothetical protein AAGC63_01075 [Propionicimonas sp.]|nr:hypothetical protein [Propionicimonas sp.]